MSVTVRCQKCGKEGHYALGRDERAADAVRWLTMNRAWQYIEATGGRHGLVTRFWRCRDHHMHEYGQRDAEEEPESAEVTLWIPYRVWNYWAEAYDSTEVEMVKCLTEVMEADR